MADPLSLLRQYNVDALQIIERDDQIIFGEFSWPKNVATTLVKTDKHSSIKEYYTLECLLYFLKNVNLTHPVYCRQAAIANMPAVRRPDRKNIKIYLFGESASCESVDNKVQLETITKAPLETTSKAQLETTTKAPLETTTKAPLESTTKAPLEPMTQLKRTHDQAGGELLAKKPCIEEAPVKKAKRKRKKNKKNKQSATSSVDD